MIAQDGASLQQAFQGIIASGGGNLTQGIVDGLAAVIASGGGNIIGQAGTNLTAKVAELMIRGGEVIASGGGNLIGQAGTNLAAADEEPGQLHRHERGDLRTHRQRPADRPGRDEPHRPGRTTTSGR